MELGIIRQELLDDERRPVHHWRVRQLTRLGVPGPLAEVYADRIDWHQVIMRSVPMLPDPMTAAPFTAGLRRTPPLPGPAHRSRP